MKVRVAFALSMLLGVASLAIFFPKPAKAQGPRVIEIHAKRFGFQPNVVTVKKGETVKLQLISEDVTHGFFSRPLKLDEALTPGQITEVTLTPQPAGKYTIICDHFCGAGHGNMAMTLVVEE